MRRHLFSAFAALLLAGGVNCSSTTAQQSCDELASKPCFGDNECVGAQQCVDGEWGSCVCDSGGAGGTAGSSGAPSTGEAGSDPTGGVNAGGNTATGGVNASGDTATGGVNAGGNTATGGVDAGGDTATGGVNAAGSDATGGVNAGGAGADTSPISFDNDDSGIQLRGSAPAGTGSELIASAGMNETGVIELTVPFTSITSALFSLPFDPPRNLQGRTIRVLLRVVEGGDAGFRIAVGSGTTYANGSLDLVSEADGWVYRTFDVDNPHYIAAPESYDPAAISDVTVEIGSYREGTVRIQIDEITF